MNMMVYKINKMEEDKISKTEIRCSKCMKLKSMRPDVFKVRVKKFGSVQKLIKNYKCRVCREKKLNNKIACSMCHELKGVRTDVYKQRIKRYGSEEKLKENYKCRKCRKIDKRLRKKENKGGKTR